jgi:hypothetical protein
MIVPDSLRVVQLAEVAYLGREKIEIAEPGTIATALNC